jgi:putative toxin-antitoxin system antitoxin component (TIGR02293 family)
MSLAVYPQEPSARESGRGTYQLSSEVFTELLRFGTGSSTDMPASPRLRASSFHQCLTPIESAQVFYTGRGPDQLPRLARIDKLAADVWGSKAEGRAFLLRPHEAFRGATPLSQLTSEEGARKVEQILAAILHGLPA